MKEFGKLVFFSASSVCALGAAGLIVHVYRKEFGQNMERKKLWQNMEKILGHASIAFLGIGLALN